MPNTLTNTQFVSDLMEFSRHGALAQIFVIDAIQKHAEHVAAADPSSINHALISGEGWVSVAREIKARIDAKYGASVEEPPTKVGLFAALLAADEAFVDGYEVETVRLQKGPDLEQTYLFTAEDVRLEVDDQTIDLTLGDECSSASFQDIEGNSHRLDLNQVVRKPVTARTIECSANETSTADDQSKQQQPEG